MNTFYPENDYRNYLCHYGVKGMKRPKGLHYNKKKNNSNSDDPRERYRTNPGITGNPRDHDVEQSGNGRWKNSNPPSSSKLRTRTSGLGKFVGGSTANSGHAVHPKPIYRYSLESVEEADRRSERNRRHVAKRDEERESRRNRHSGHRR